MGCVKYQLINCTSLWNLFQRGNLIYRISDEEARFLAILAFCYLLMPRLQQSNWLFSAGSLFSAPFICSEYISLLAGG